MGFWSANMKYGSLTRTLYTGVCRQCREKHACHLKQFQSSQQPTSENIAAKNNPPRKRVPIPPEMFSSPSGMDNSLISNKDYKQPLTPASAKTAYNQYVYKLHEATGISERFRHLDSVLMKEWKDVLTLKKKTY